MTHPWPAPTDPCAPPPEWSQWAPPLNPPTEGGMPRAVAEALADDFWDDDPHLAAALMWEWYAATLPPEPSVSSVNTGAQAVNYSPPGPAGAYGAALARAAWHRSFLGDLISVPLVVREPPADDPLLWIDPS